MAGTFYPEQRAEFVIFMEAMMTYVNANLLALGLTVPEVAALNSTLVALKTAIVTQESALNAYRAATQDVDAKELAAEREVQQFNQQMQASPTITDQQKAAMGLPVYDTTPTAVPPPSTRPVFEIDISDRLRHIIKFRDELTPDNRAKPKGVRECEIWHKISETEPATESEYLYLAGDSATPYVAVYNGPDAGKTVWYLLRWKNTRGITGPWSFPLSAKVPG